jgi:hypothetical protein
MRYVAPRHNLELTLEVIFEHVLGIKTMTSLILDLIATAYLYLRISTGEKVMILFLSHSLGIVTRTEQDLIAHSGIFHL